MGDLGTWMEAGQLGQELEGSLDRVPDNGQRKRYLNILCKCDNVQ